MNRFSPKLRLALGGFASGVLLYSMLLNIALHNTSGTIWDLCWLGINVFSAAWAWLDLREKQS
jgi:hypothetical protein